jgi:ribonuclease BN (tRNA processing enzyme)
MTTTPEAAIKLAEEAAVEAIALEHGPQRYAEQARDGNWPIFRAARTAALIALRARAALAEKGEAA